MIVKTKPAVKDGDFVQLNITPQQLDKAIQDTQWLIDTAYDYADEGDGPRAAVLMCEARNMMNQYHLKVVNVYLGDGSTLERIVPAVRYTPADKRKKIRRIIMIQRIQQEVK